MTLAGKKNPVRLLGQAIQCWWSFRGTGAFAWGDAWMNWQHWLLPSRMTYRVAGAALERLVNVTQVEPGVHRVTLRQAGLTFYWLGSWTPNVYHTIAQEFDVHHPHCYTTDPVVLRSDSCVVDVGACEGLFACRVLRQGLAGRIIAFEPSARTAYFLKEAARLNGVADRLMVEVKAVTARSGRVRFVEGDAPEANRVEPGPVTVDQPGVEAVTLDDYCAGCGLRLGPWDLIKIDAEGADLDVLRGAERVLREGAPQVAVTTYHVESHAREMWNFLRSIQPAYRFRIKGLWLFGPVRFFGGARLRPVLLQAAVPVGQRLCFPQGRSGAGAGAALRQGRADLGPSGLARLER